MTDEEMNDIYIEILGRHIDDSGRAAYSDRDPSELRKILLASPEYAHYSQIKLANTYVKPKYNTKSKESFNVVICRYDEDVSFIDDFVYYPCIVYLYNKGPPIQRRFKGAIKVIECENIGFEDYVYLRYITENSMDTPVLFMQCCMDHSPRLFNFLDSFDKFSGFESMSEGKGLRDPISNNMQITEYGVYFNIDVTPFNFEDILMIFSKSINIKVFFDERYNVKIQSNMFVPGAAFFIRPEHFDKSVRYDVILKDIEYAHSLGKYISKRLASVFERYLWFNIKI